MQLYSNSAWVKERVAILERWWIENQFFRIFLAQFFLGIKISFVRTNNLKIPHPLISLEHYCVKLVVWVRGRFLCEGVSERQYSFRPSVK